jgi:hypothetical protein
MAGAVMGNYLPMHAHAPADPASAAETDRAIAELRAGWVAHARTTRRILYAAAALIVRLL